MSNPPKYGFEITEIPLEVHTFMAGLLLGLVAGFIIAIIFS